MVFTEYTGILMLSGKSTTGALRSLDACGARRIGQAETPFG
jgi:hypothetical protein